MLAFGVVAGAMPATATAVSTADEQYSAALRLKPDLDRGARLFALCSGCHGLDGEGTGDGSVPAIAGQFAPVLVNQLIEFRYDARHDLRVQGFLTSRQLTPQDLADLSAYVSSLPPPQPPSSPEALQTAQGAALYANLCAGCHGAHGEGDRSASVPRLAGQHREYLFKQLRDAARGARAPMERDHARLLRQLSIDDMNTVATYLAQEFPVPPRPP